MMYSVVYIPLYSKVNQLHTHIDIHSFLDSSPIGHYRVSSSAP